MRAQTAPVGAGTDAARVLVFAGPTLSVDIGFDLDFKPNSGATPVPGIRGVQALVDTGASECCIDGELASRLNLPIIDRRPVAGAHGAKEVNFHLAQIYFPSLKFIMY